MQQYPLKTGDVIEQKDIDAGRTNFCFDYKDYIQRINAAFYNGFMTATLETKEDADAVTPVDRALMCALAMDKSALLCGTGGGHPNLDATLSILSDKEDLTND